MKTKNILLAFVMLAGTLPAFGEGKTYRSHSFYKWTVRHGPYAEYACDRGQLLEIKDIAEQDALDACREGGHKNCVPNGATILVNGSLMKERYAKIAGIAWPPSVLGGYYYGCIARGSATAID